MTPGSPYFEDVIAVADSFYEGTWASGALPEEVIVFELCCEMKWTLEDWYATPVYWRKVFADLLYAKRMAENARHERDMKKKPNGT